jgi:hypothetical protein
MIYEEIDNIYLLFYYLTVKIKILLILKQKILYYIYIYHICYLYFCIIKIITK